MEARSRTRLKRTAIALLAAVASTFVCAGVPSTAFAVSVNDDERAEVRRINRYRVSKGLKRLTIDYKLTQVAEWMARDMVAYDYFSHVDHLGRDPFERLSDFGYPSDTWRGENLAAGNRDPAETFQQWKNSRPHRRNMLNGNYRAIGVARVCNADTTYGCYWVTEFGSKVIKAI